MQRKERRKLFADPNYKSPKWRARSKTRVAKRTEPKEDSAPARYKSANSLLGNVCRTVCVEYSHSICLCQAFLESPPLAKAKLPIGGGFGAKDNRRQSSRRSLSVGDHGGFNNTSFATGNNAIDSGGGLLAGLNLGTPDYQEPQTYDK